MKKTMAETLKSIIGFVNRAFRDHVSAYASQAAYFIILSFIPFIMFLLTIVRYTPLTEDMIKQVFVEICPDNFHGLVIAVVNEVYRKTSAVLPITLLLSLWSSGKGVQAITNGLNTIYHVKETRGWLTTRLWSVFYTLVFVLAIVASLVLLVFGNSLQKSLTLKWPWMGRLIGQIIGARTLVAFLVLMFVFLALYKVLPNRKATFKSQMPGAFLTAVAWMAFSYVFSLYYTFFPNTLNIYGSFATIILIMLWMYVCMNIVLYGAEVNAYFEKQFRDVQKIAREWLDRDKENGEAG
ncbi:MAG: YihY/virulence factor BrkB family protein [Lachnospiraceae bacterium]|nr:YihY/virulence factor BrkB family protein [Lachnospiraceae bacterium]MCI9545948.1 YihY/virulence factor BrkB family protein [Lachnospiraceae bacterium]